MTDPLPLRPSNRPFRPALRALMSRREITFRQLSAATGVYREEGPVSLGFLSQLLKGERSPTLDMVRVIALGAGVDPTYFKEWREHVACERAVETMHEAGLDAVLEALRNLRQS